MDTGMRTLPVLPALLALSLVAAGCAEKSADKPPEPVANITTATAVTQDVPVVESAVGAETSVAFAQALDPNRLQRGTRSIRLPFPDHVARRLRIGQPVTLIPFADEANRARGRITGIRPALSSTTRSVEVIVAVDTPDWRPVGSVRGEVVLEVRKNAVVIPEQAVVLRPAGTVVYVLNSETVKAREVTTGVTRDGEVEIVSGLKAGEVVAHDGAALLTDGARVSIRGSGP
jgi:multidrug efflux pump subunit AcrA (membrane-fusion protein)